MRTMADLQSGSATAGAIAAPAYPHVHALRSTRKVGISQHAGSLGATSRAFAHSPVLDSCPQLRGFAAAPVAEVRADDVESAAAPARGFIAGGHSLADFPPERIRNFSIIAHVDHGAAASPRAALWLACAVAFLSQDDVHSVGSECFLGYVGRFVR